MRFATAFILMAFVAGCDETASRGTEAAGTEANFAAAGLRAFPFTNRFGIEDRVVCDVNGETDAQVQARATAAIALRREQLAQIGNRDLAPSGSAERRAQLRAIVQAETAELQDGFSCIAA